MNCASLFFLSESICLVCNRSRNNLRTCKAAKGKMISFLLMVTVFGVITRAGCRQMCLSCQYADNAKQEGLECATDPYNWPLGNTKVRCPFVCVTDAHFDQKTGKLLFIYRGCRASADVMREEDCEVEDGQQVCAYSCQGAHYCNNATITSPPTLPRSDKGDNRRGWHWKYSTSPAEDRYGWHWLVLPFLLVLCEL